MDRTDARNAYRKRMALAIGASIGVHALVLTSVTLDLPAFGDAETPRPLRMVELPDDWQTGALEVIALESAAAPDPALRTAGASGGGGAPSAETRAAATRTAAADPTRPVEVALPSAAPRPATPTPSLDLRPAAENAASTPGIAARPARGVLLRADAGEMSHAGLEFYAASDAARDAEEDERGAGRPGRGIGISISGPGACPGAGGMPLVGGRGGLGEVPTTGKGLGIIGARPPNRGAINRAAPPIGGGGGR